MSILAIVISIFAIGYAYGMFRAWLIARTWEDSVRSKAFAILFWPILLLAMCFGNVQ